MIRLCTVLFAATLAACQPAGQEADGQPPENANESTGPAEGLCGASVTPIADVQGGGFSSPLVGEVVTVRGVVTLANPGTGVFIQEARPFSAGPASHGLLVASAEVARAGTRGNLLTVTGKVGEIGDREDTITAIIDIRNHADCGPGPEPPVFDARLPMTPEERESYEGMRLFLEQPLTVSAVSDVDEGKIMVSALGMPKAPTEVSPPGPQALANERRNHDWSLSLINGELSELEPYTRIHAGTLVNELTGVLGHDGRQPSLITEGTLALIPRPAPTLPEADSEIIRAASFNLHEYFNGDGSGGGFPGERGARSLREFERQAERIVAAISQIRPHVLAVQEIENDGFGPNSAVQAFAKSLSGSLDVNFEVAQPGSDRVGSDVISVGLLYRPDTLQAIGPARLLEGGTFGPLNRVPLAQVFEHRESGVRFLVVSNHLKSKGFCPESGPDTNQGDGQACWNRTRIEGALETVKWARALAAEAGTGHFLLLGDFNAYRMEDPVRAITDQGLSELVAHHQPGMPQYSYLYRGAAGTLDYAFASESLTPLCTDAFIWHINAAYPWSARPSQPWLRSSDHDPVIVDLRLNQAATSD